MKRLFERLVAKITLLEGEEKKKKGEHVRLVAFLNKKEAQFWVMNEQSKVMTLIAFLDFVCYSNKDIKEKPPDIIIDDEKREPVLHSKLEKHITHARDSHLLLQYTKVLLGGIFVICGQLNEISDDNEVEIVVAAGVSLQLSHLLRNALTEEFYEHEKLCIHGSDAITHLSNVAYQ
ncbi:hypothetical protein V6N11_001932 [Hibiscus sabdariffa]|uniref:Uncharacterized protein n=1 Tax=Hibiscus sabdariffa TaxID=183260 RepID=A0ABR2QTQ7_9ROSI